MFYLRASRNSRLLRSFLILVICAGVLALLQVTKARVDGPRSLLTRGFSPLSLGDYPDTSMQLGANTTVMPDTAPTATTSINVSTSTSFKGQLVGDPATGVVRVTDAYPAGTYTVKVTAFDGVPTTKTFTLTVTTPAPCNPVTFAGPTNFTVGIHPTSMAIGDFNGDGRQDLATTNVNSGDVSLLLGDGAGSFGAAAKIVVGGLPAFLAVGDFNGDGNQDLATANATSADVSILLGNGAGGFSVFDTFGAGSNPESVAVGDFNNDGKQDLAVANSGSNDVSVLLGDGMGSFSLADSFGAGSNPESVAVGDFDNDAKQDLAVTNSGSNDVSVLLGDGMGSFDAAPNLAVGITPQTVTVGDFDGDGKQDLAIANGSSGNVSILEGKGTGEFNVANNFDVGTNPFSVAVGDFNSDGKQDLAVANVDSNNVSVLLGDGAGSFSATTNFGVGTRPFSVVAGDFNADGKQDVAAANLDSNNVSLLLRQCPPPFLVTNTDDSGPGSFRQAIIYANDNFGPNTINFNIPGAGVKTITPTSPLPTITGPVVIDGYTQPGASVNTLATGDNAVLLIELNGANAGVGTNGLTINAASSTVRGLVINRFRGHGISLQNNLIGGSIIEGNFIGTDTGGTADWGNSANGVNITNANNSIGGTSPAARNVISGNDSHGLQIDGPLALANIVAGNRIGTNAAGTTAIPNTANGVLVSNKANSNTIGGTIAAARNIISGNDYYGILLADSTATRVLGNFIGTDITGTDDLGNAVSGIAVSECDDTIIGGTTAGERNVISGNSRDGITIVGSSGTLVQGNFIGTQANGSSAMGNSLRGVDMSANSNTIGGVVAGAANTIANNGLGGVRILSNGGILGTGNRISGNSIFANGTTPQDLGIDLGFDGVTTNDPGDGDMGPNNLQNFPVLMAVVNTGSDTVVRGRLNSMPSTSFDVQFFSNQACDPLGYGEGQTFIGSTTVTTDVMGNGTINTTLAVPVALGQFVTATATDPGNNTSEFSACQIVTLPSLSIDDVSLTEGNSGTTSFMFTVSLSNPSSEAITVNYATANGTATTVDNDYLSTSGTLIFAPGETSKPVTVLVNGDTKFEPDETFFVNLSSPVSATISDSQGQGTIVNDDAQPTITINDVSELEGNSSSAPFTFTVSLSNASYQTVTVNYATANGTATTADNDYSPTSGTLTFDPGEGSKLITVLVNGDTKFEADETFSVNLSDRTNAGMADALGVGTILNDDPPGALTISDVSQTEGNSGTASFDFTVSLSLASAQTVTVKYATADNTAASGSDYQAIGSTTLTFNPGEISKQVTIVVTGDTSTEADETFFVNLTDPTNATIIDGQGVGTIKNDDPSSPGTWTISGQITDSGNNPLPDVTVTLSGPVARMVQSDVTGKYSFTSLTPLEDYTVTVQSANYIFSPSRLEFLDLDKDQTANFIAAPVSVGPALALRDDFTCKVTLTTCAPDPDKWSVGAQSPSRPEPFDSRVTVVQQNGELVITPLDPRESGAHYNGIVSAKPVDINNGEAVVEISQAATCGADTSFAMGNNPSNFFRFMVHTADKSGMSSSLTLEAVTAGQLNALKIDYDPEQHRFMRFRHEPPSEYPPSGAIVFEAGPDGVNYKFLHRAAFGNKPLEPMRVELLAGTTGITGCSNPTSAPQPAKFDNVQVNGLPFSGGNLKTILAADQVTMRTWTFHGRTYAFVRLSFPNAGYRVADGGQVVRAANDFSADAVVERPTTPGSVQAVKTEALIYDLGPLIPGIYTFTFKNSGVVVKSEAFSSTPLPANPIDDLDQRPFVRQQYLDFLNREPDDAGWDHWTREITQCTSDPSYRLPGESEAHCIIRKRAYTSAAFFLSPEFQNTGYFVLRVYRGSLGRMPYYGGCDPADNLKDEFTRDHATVSAGIVANDQLNAARIDANKLAFTNAFVNRAEFRAIYDSLNNQQYVDKLIETTGIQPNTPPLQQERQQLIAGLSSPIPTETRASVLFKIVDGTRTEANGALVFETAFGRAFYEQQFNAAFVQMEYFGYLHRDPDDAGYAFWLSKLNQFTKPNEFKGDFVNAQMVLAFISSPEYRSRFGQP